MRKHGITYPNVHDGPGDIGTKYGVTGFPETYFVDRRGRLVGERVVGRGERRQADRRGSSARSSRETRRRAARSPWCWRRRRRRASVTRRSGELEGEVMCPTCKTTLDQSSAPIANRIRQFISGADRGRRHQERDQAEARRPVRAGDPGRAVEARVQPAGVGAAVPRRSGWGRRRSGWLVWRWSRGPRAIAGRRGWPAARPGARAPGRRRACSLRWLASSPVAFVGRASSPSSRRACCRSSPATCRRSRRSRRAGSASPESRAAWCLPSLPFVARLHCRVRAARRRRGGDRAAFSTSARRPSSPASS